MPSLPLAVTDWLVEHALIALAPFYVHLQGIPKDAPIDIGAPLYSLTSLSHRFDRGTFEGRLHSLLMALPIRRATYLLTPSCLRVGPWGTM